MHHYLHTDRPEVGRVGQLWAMGQIKVCFSEAYHIMLSQTVCSIFLLGNFVNFKYYRASTYLLKFKN